MTRISFDSRRCIGCKACEAACQQENNLPAGVKWRCVTERLEGQYPMLKKEFLSLACCHCEKPPCAGVCLVSALTINQDTGVVVLDSELCTGCRACVEACPFKAMAFDIKKARAGKCCLCLHRLKQGLLPACVQSCLALALQLNK